ncbi:MAG: DNA double-strand break repair nuclease NurA [Promethearchaeati archaeon SRVP18_Atabeyarchaeia-1]
MSLPFRVIREKLERLPSILPVSALAELTDLKYNQQIMLGKLEPVESADPLKGIPIALDSHIMRGRSTISIDGGSNFWVLPFGTLLLGRAGAARRYFSGAGSPPTEYLVSCERYPPFFLYYSKLLFGDSEGFVSEDVEDLKSLVRDNVDPFEIGSFISLLRTYAENETTLEALDYTDRGGMIIRDGNLYGPKSRWDADPKHNMSSSYQQISQLEEKYYQVFLEKDAMVIGIVKRPSQNVVVEYLRSNSKEKFDASFPTDCSLYAFRLKPGERSAAFHFRPPRIFGATPYSSPISFVFFYIKPTKWSAPFRVEIPDYCWERWGIREDLISKAVYAMSLASAAEGVPHPLMCIHRMVRVERSALLIHLRRLMSEWIKDRGVEDARLSLGHFASQYFVGSEI